MAMMRGELASISGGHGPSPRSLQTEIVVGVKASTKR
jgi:hypothetical protein